MTVPIGRPAAERPCRVTGARAVHERDRTYPESLSCAARAPVTRRGFAAATDRHTAGSTARRFSSVTSVPLWQAGQSAGRGDDTRVDRTAG